jgi:hypothetical protein
LNLRAWTLHESLLSTRTVVFSKDEIEWRCRSKSTCDCGYLENVPDRSQQVSLYSVKTPEEAFSFWQSLVYGNYSKRRLTLRKDKLPALSGVASVIRRLTGSAYLGGLWKDNIFQDLSWTERLSVGMGVDKFGRLRPRPDGYRGMPSFSWASTDARVYFIGVSDPHPTLLDAEVDVMGSNPLGQLR